MLIDKIIAVGFMFTFVGIIFTSCTNSSIAIASVSNNDEIKFVNDFSLNVEGPYIMKDTQTGVEYIVLEKGKEGLVVVPRINADGSLYIGE